MSAAIDLGPLTWVKSEIDSSLERSRAALRAWVTNQKDRAQLQTCQQHLHQASGAVQIVGLEGMSLFFAQTERVLSELEAGRLKPDATVVNVLERSITAIGRYLTELTEGAPDQALRLYPEYRQLVEVCGGSPPVEADLYFPDLSLEAPQREHPATHIPPDQVEVFLRAQRASYQRGFVRWMREPANATALADMRSAVDAIEQTLAMPAQRAFWWSAGALLDALATQGLGPEPGVKLLAGRIEQLLRKMTAPSAPIPETLRRETLYWIAKVPPQSQSDLVRSAWWAFRLAGTLPGEAAPAGAADTPLRMAALAALIEAVAAAKAAWTRCAAGDANARPLFAAQARAAADPAGVLDNPPLAALTAELVRVATHFESGSGPVTDAAATEVATALLVLEGAVAQGGRASADLERRVAAINERLAAAVFGGAAPGPFFGGSLFDEETRRTQDKHTSGTVLGEIHTNLQRIEQLLDTYFRDPTKALDWKAVEALLHQVSGALHMLDEEEARAALEGCAARIRGFAEVGSQPALADFEEVAQALSGIGFYVEALRQGTRPEFATLMQPLGGPRAALIEEAAPFALADAPAAQPETTGGLELMPAVADAQSASAPEGKAQVAVQGGAEKPVDQEMLAIFLEEAREVLAAIQENLAVCVEQPASRPHLTAVRRSFHTLKGSGRMVGLTQLGEAAWALEQVMNLWLQEERAASADLLSLIERARVQFADWVGRLERGEGQPDPRALIDAAESVRRGEPFDAGEQSVGAAIELAVDAPVGMSVEAVEDMPVSPEPQGASATDTAPGASLDFEMTEPPVEVLSEAEVLSETVLPEPAAIELADTVRDTVADLDFGVVAPSAETEPAMQESAEARDILANLDFDSLLPADGAEAGAVLPQSDEAEAGAGPLDFDIPDIAEPTATSEPTAAAAQTLEPLADAAEPVAQAAEPEEIEIGGQVISASLYAVFMREAAQHLEVMERELALAATLGGVGDELVRTAHTFGGICGTVRIAPMRELGRALEEGLRALQRRAAPPQGSELRLLAYCIGTLRTMYADVLARRAPRPRDDLIASLKAVPANLAAPEPEALSPAPVEPQASDAEVLSEPEIAVAYVPAAESAPVSAPVAVIDETESVPIETAAIAVEVPALQAPTAEIFPERRKRRIEDDVDPELLPVFLAEAHELAPQAGELLRAWRKDSANPELAMALQRTLHTFKGGARMAGAMSLGELTHSMETRIENAIELKSFPAQLFDDLETSCDRMGVLLDRLQKPAVPDAPVPDEAQTALAELPPSAPESAAAPARTGLAARALLRVQAEVLEKLVNRAGEVAVARSRIEMEQRALKTALNDLVENIARLRGQLREIEIQAETQMQARAREFEERAQKFDPLEFDRFTRLQELTRMMAESVGDVSTVQQHIARVLDGTETALSEQARLNRELQQDLMRVRMVPVSSIADRLHRLVRQTAKELGKRVNFDIRGGSIEMDRSVLERITGPIEHLLRNSITHGIEDTAGRAARGKAEFGEIRLDVGQDGNEIVLTYSDDGGGLDLERIRARAIERKLLLPGDEVDDGRLAEFIFVSGFSTAEEVTEVAGRGVGMDVVREEVRALGGRVAVATTPGQGARFTIRLPLTTAVTQAVLVRSGTRTCALPAVSVEQVRRLSTEQLAAVRAEGRITWAGRDYPLAYLPELLGEAGAPGSDARQRAPLLLVRSGPDTVALLVDDVIANQEVVVKNLGPQLARVPGVAGVSVLGSGEIVLILNPLPLLRLARVAVPEPAAVDEGPRPKIVMVVDDSLTVRKIAGRLLTREGYQVLAAKDGIDAMEQLASVVPDAMLVDIEMPRMDGFDLTRNVRSDARLARVPIVMITSRAADKHRAYAVELGVDVFLGKPYRDDELLGHLARLTGATPVGS